MLCWIVLVLQNAAGDAFRHCFPANWKTRK